MKKLPNLYTNTFDKKIDNSKEYIIIKDEEQTEKNYTKLEINKKIDNIFKSKDYIYKIKTKITLNNEEKSITLIGKTNKHVITIDNELININEIQDIKKEI